MTDDRNYMVFGIGLILFLSVANFRGWTFADVDEVKQVPKTVRDNPGSYRAHYSSHYHYYGGK